MSYKFIDGGVTAPSGFTASGIAAGLKKNRLDMALVVSVVPASVAGMFTTNKMYAAPVALCMEQIKSGSASAIIINSGNANACTGKQGFADAARMAELTAESLGINSNEVLVCSTGTIGVPMPMDKLETGIPMAVKELSEDGGQIAAKAIMTTDLVSKTLAYEFEIDGKSVRIGGMAKGSGMIEPNMATMLAFLTTDADVDSAALQKCLFGAVERSFNRITVDGDQSTNDTVLFLANGKAGNRTLDASHPEWNRFVQAVNDIALGLARMIVKDGEGATKFVTVTTNGAANGEDALKVCRAVANSLLVKTSWFGEDPNWGRVIDAVGYCGAEVNPVSVDIYYDDFIAVKNGGPVGLDVAKGISKVIANDEFCILIDLNIGDGADTVYTCDCSYDYVKINSEYMT